MCIVRDLLTKEDLRYLKRVLAILPEEAPISYEVWAIGHTKNNIEVLLRSFGESWEAIEYAKSVTPLDAIIAVSEGQGFDFSTDYIFIEVETVIDDNKGGTMNIGTAYKNTLFLLEDIG